MMSNTVPLPLPSLPIGCRSLWKSSEARQTPPDRVDSLTINECSIPSNRKRPTESVFAPMAPAERMRMLMSASRREQTGDHQRRGPGKETIMWVFDGERWSEDGGNLGNGTPIDVDYGRASDVRPRLQTHEMLPEPPAGVRNPTPWVPARRIRR
jgi:hypothetical protein